MNYKKLKEGEKTEMPISSQVTLNDKNWKIVKKFRFIENGKYKYTFLAECIHCGFQKEVSNSGIYKGNIKCPHCFCQNEVGKVYGCYEIIEFLGYTDHKERLYKSKCIKCGHVFEKRRIDDIRTPIKESCRFCNSIKGNFAFNYLLNDYKSGAKSRNLVFELTNDEFYSLITKSCKYCGQEPELRIFRKGLTGECKAKVNGIDRVNSNIGYIKSNCVPCCTKCNLMKSNYTSDDFLTHISKIYHYNVKGSTTISQESTSQANGDGNGGYPEMDNDIV